jgi:hypothetical protein
LLSAGGRSPFDASVVFVARAELRERMKVSKAEFIPVRKASFGDPLLIKKSSFD